MVSLKTIRSAIIPLVLGQAFTGPTTAQMPDDRRFGSTDFGIVSPEARRERLDAARRWAEFVAKGDQVRYERELQNAVQRVTGQAADRALDLFSPNFRIYYQLVPFYGTETYGAQLTQPPLRDSPILQPQIQLEQGDVITHLDSVPIRNAAELENHYTQTSVTFINSRTNQLETRWVTLSAAPQRKGSGYPLGITTTPAQITHPSVHAAVTPNLTESAQETSLGLRITEVAPGSPAAEAGLNPGDTILRAGSRASTDIDALRQSIVESTGVLPLTVVNPKGKIRTLVVKLRIDKKN